MKLNKFPFLFTFKHSSGNIIYFAIDRLVQGRSTGGIRVKPGITPEEAFANAHLMTRKMAVTNIPCGGAKLCLDPKYPDKVMETLQDFGKRISTLLVSKEYIPGVDIASKIEHVNQLLGPYGKEYNFSNEISSSYYTAFGVFVYMELTRKKDFPPEEFPVSVSIEGCGKVGFELFKMVTENPEYELKYLSDKSGTFAINGKEDIELIKISKTKEVWTPLSDILNSKVGEPSVISTLKCDILVPGASVNFINKNNADDLKTKAIIPISNLPYEKGILEKLKKKELIFFPDYITNSGGVMGAMLRNIGFNEFYTEYVIRKHYKLIFDFISKKINEESDFFFQAEKLIEEKLNTPLWKGEKETKPVTQVVRKFAENFKLFPRNIRRRFITTWYLPHSAMWSWHPHNPKSFKL